MNHSVTDHESSAVQAVLLTALRIVKSRVLGTIAQVRRVADRASHCGTVSIVGAGSSKLSLWREKHILYMQKYTMKIKRVFFVHDGFHPR